MLMIIYQTITALSFFALITMGIVIDKKTQAKKTFAVFCFISASWVLSNFLTTIIERAEVMQLTYSTGIATALAIMLWAHRYTRISNVGFVNIDKKFIITSYILVGLFMILAMVPGAIVNYTKFIYMGTWEGVPGSFFYIWAVTTAFYIWLTIWIIYTRYKNTSVKSIKERFLYIFLVLFFVATTITVGSLILPMFGVLQLANLDAPSFGVFVILLWHFISTEHLIRIKTFLIQIVLFMLVSFVIAALYLSYANIAGEMINKYFGVIFSSFILAVILYLLLNSRFIHNFLFPATLEKMFLNDFSVYIDKILNSQYTLEKTLDITSTFLGRCGISSPKLYTIDEQQDTSMFKDVKETGCKWDKETGELLLGVVTPSYKIIYEATADRDFYEYERYIPLVLKILKNSIDKVAIDSIAQRDQLSGLYRREYFISRVKTFLLTAKRREIPVAILTTDIDNFKQINDKYGHDVGDKVIQYFAQSMKESFRGGALGDIIGRIGGEEFAVCFTHRDTEVNYKTFVTGVCGAAERFRKNVIIKNRPEPLCDPITATCGLVYSSTVYDYDILMKNADLNLYQGKASGKNVVVATEVTC